jgi:hypothetical protein
MPTVPCLVGRPFNLLLGLLLLLPLLIVVGVVLYDSEIFHIILQGTENDKKCSSSSPIRDGDDHDGYNNSISNMQQQQQQQQLQDTQLVVPQEVQQVKSRAGLSIFTLSYDPQVEDPTTSQKLLEKRQRAQDMMLHNCLLTKQYDPSAKDFQFIVITDDLSMKVCQHCHCRLFVPYNCSCPLADCSNRRNVCEKNHLFADLLQQKGEYIFVDFDLVLLYPTVLQELRLRSQTSDFVATRAHGSFTKKPKYRQDFNSGLVYIRHVPEANPALLKQYLYDHVANPQYDQAILSYFVHHHYHRWDELSIKWHCRMLKEPPQQIDAMTSKQIQEEQDKGSYGDMSIQDCQTLHPPKDWMLQMLNYTLLTPL